MRGVGELLVAEGSTVKVDVTGCKGVAERRGVGGRQGLGVTLGQDGISATVREGDDSGY